MLQRVRARTPGWEEAFARLLECHRSVVYRRCLFRLGDIQDAEDALQETMLRAWQGIGTFQGRSALRTWLVSIADNECSSLAHRRKRHQCSEHMRCLIQIHEEHQRTLAVSSPDKVRMVRETLERLPPRAREVLGLRFFGEASLSEISRTLGIGMSATKMRLYRALDLFEAIYRDAWASSPTGAVSVIPEVEACVSEPVFAAQEPQLEDDESDGSRAQQSEGPRILGPRDTADIHSEQTGKQPQRQKNRGNHGE
jgi:RNA polymerase sigma-70 factor (ECF subfamily)